MSRSVPWLGCGIETRPACLCLCSQHHLMTSCQSWFYLLSHWLNVLQAVSVPFQPLNSVVLGFSNTLKWHFAGLWQWQKECILANGASQLLNCIREGARCLLSACLDPLFSLLHRVLCLGRLVCVDRHRWAAMPSVLLGLAVGSPGIRREGAEWGPSVYFSGSPPVCCCLCQLKVSAPISSKQLRLWILLTI